ncbi:TlyA family RNA methyltransferase [Helicobacter sp. 11S03491-1]|uniref:23S rRNA (cytidine-2'-O)-methyltransferase TlyA n=1 Tax=Helicobacter sp. 11S03491-1 TaxID=1476196 RepID=UPI000BA7BE45|nr:TlyA family RNA methyltransferase [Helicobacter sp. 11S03491-1]PAF42542.1 hypothetical protein BKH45_03245 [Helicobacter sp. 11S03491-1]
MRLDSYLAQNAYCKSREKAKELIRTGKVSINGNIITKTSFEILESLDNMIEINSKNMFVSRAGQKLLNYLLETKISCENKSILDVGSSTGGFAQVLLHKGALEVTCVDVGYNQMDIDLKKDPRICLFEQCDIREFVSDKKFDLIVCDVSFISLSKILDYLCRLGDKFILLFKPQFEVGRRVKRNKKGVIQDKEAIKTKIKEFANELQSKNLAIYDMRESTLKGKEGNEEFFFYIAKS